MESCGYLGIIALQKGFYDMQYLNISILLVNKELIIVKIIIKYLFNFEVFF
jgi:hypothetical protein